MYNRHMQDLYERLKACGFNMKFIRDVVLPDWWDDSLAAVPANRAIAEMAMARHLGFGIRKLSNPKAKLTLGPVRNFRLKCARNMTLAAVRPAVVVAQRAVKLVLESTSGLPDFRATCSAQNARQAILAKQPYVNLEALVNFCWDNGVAVMHLDPTHLPKVSKKFHGISMFHENTPVVVLGSGRDSPPWLAFHLAHELAHIFLKHVRAGDKPLVDSDIDHVDDDRQEREANEFATELLTGEETLSFDPVPGLTAEKLVPAACEYGEQHATDPGTVVLIYGRSANRWPAAQNALKRLKQETGAKRILVDALAERLDDEDIPESTARFLSCLSLTCT